MQREAKRPSRSTVRCRPVRAACTWSGRITTTCGASGTARGVTSGTALAPTRACWTRSRTCPSERQSGQVVFLAYKLHRGSLASSEARTSGHRSVRSRPRNSGRSRTTSAGSRSRYIAVKPSRNWPTPAPRTSSIRSGSRSRIAASGTIPSSSTTGCSRRAPTATAADQHNQRGRTAPKE
jgi:hypothetical protein